jgi:hypothetical protein
MYLFRVDQGVAVKGKTVIKETEGVTIGVSVTGWAADVWIHPGMIKAASSNIPKTKT